MKSLIARCAACLMAMLPAAALAGVPPEGVDLQVRRGFFTETDIGGFFTVGGNDRYSNLQTYLQLGVGYDVSRNIELGAHVGMGSNAANCFAGKDSRGLCSLSDNFTVTFFDVTAAYLIPLSSRLYLAPKVLAGYTVLDPSPVAGTSPLSAASGPNVGGALGLEYATSMDHFSVGIDVGARWIMGADILTLQFFPRVKYTF
jgi:hypothetical protein